MTFSALTDAPTHPYLLHVAGLSHAFHVHRFRGRERLSRPYVFDLRFVTARNIAASHGTLVGRAATFTFRGDEVARSMHGVVVAQSLEGHPSRNDRRQVRVRLASRLWLLSQRVNTRIFQGMNVVAIVATVLRGVGLTLVAELDRRYPLLDHCAQYRETDLAFVHRLLAEHGICYRIDQAVDDGAQTDEATRADLEGVTVFTQGSGEAGDPATSQREVIALFDRAERYARVAPLAYAPPRDGGAGLAAAVQSFAQRAAVRATSVAVRQFDFRQPMAPMESQASTLAGRRDLPRPVDALPLEVYDHRDEYLEPPPDRGGARLRLDRAQSRAETYEGESTSRAVAAGARFDLVDHPYQEFQRAYAVVDVAHEGEVPELAGGDATGVTVLYRNRFRCVPADVLARPAHHPREPVQVVESATVVGPREGFPYTDEHGRVRVRFHWDRRAGASADESSAWVRVAQQWAGGHHGAQFVPRAGMEVLVAFLDGDPDRPVVTGCLYNGARRPPFDLPGDLGRSGWRSDSLGGHGYNELSFEDTAGHEQVRVRAQRDLDVDVGHDRAASVGHDDRARVHGDQTLHVGGARTTDVVGDDLRTVHGQERVRVENSRTVEVVGADTERITGPRVTVIDASCSTTVGTSQAPAVQGSFTFGVHQVDASDRLVLSADRAVLVQCGESSIELRPDRIVLRAPRVEVAAGERAEVTGGGFVAHVQGDLDLVARRVRASAAGASAVLTDVVRLQGSAVHLDGPSSPPTRRDATSDAPATRPFTVRMRDARGEPMAHRRYVLVIAGARHEGVTDGEGAVRADVDPAAEFGVLTVYLHDAPDDRAVVVAVRVRALDDVDAPRGAQARLRNLGYDPGAPADDVTPAMIRALRAFQSAHGVEVTGALDAATVAALTHAHGH